MGKGDNRLTPLIKKRRAQKKRKAKLAKALEDQLEKAKLAKSKRTQDRFGSAVSTGVASNSSKTTVKRK